MLTIVNWKEPLTPPRVEGPYNEILADWRTGQSPITLTLIRASTEFHTWNEVAQDISTARRRASEEKPCEKGSGSSK